jgi:alginate O-acetyltransferase complex protein AlgI
VNLGLLVFYKYANFIVENANGMLTVLHLAPIKLSHVDLPIGISFFTFQAMSYVIDVYRRECEVQYNPLNTALYVSLFPQLIAGPIVRYVDVEREINSRRVTTIDLAEGIQRFIIGLGKKVLIANTVASAADQIFAIPSSNLSTSLSWLGVSCYALQIYFDFSGYSDMAIGLGKMLGFHFLENFNYPYISRSIQEFWRRWHISLSTWFRDYLYIPLGGSRVSNSRMYFNLLTVFFLCGLWHGASWNFVIWGLYHGLFLVLERTRFGVYVSSLRRPVQHTYTVLVVLVGWVLFRAETLGYALSYLRAMGGMGAGNTQIYTPAMYLHPELILTILLGIVGSTSLAKDSLIMLDRYLVGLGRENDVPLISRTYSVAKVFVLLFVLLASSMSLANGTYNPFIYYRF